MTDVSILHLDMDAFFASVEQRDDPRLQGKPVAVGGGSHRGVVAAASYEARHYGIRSAMPMAQARARCPHLVVVPPRGAVYRAVSDQVMRHVRAVTPIIEQLSLDEAFLDVSGAHRLFGSSMSIAQRLRSTIRAEVGLPASVGIATTKSVAKLLSALAKPDGCLMWPAGEVPERLRNLHVAALWGAGPQTVRTLTANGIVKVADLVDSDPVVLARLIGPVAAQRLQALGRGDDPRPVDPSRPAKSISTESTFDEDISDPVVISARLTSAGWTLAARLRDKQLVARTIGIKVRFADFATITRSRTLAEPTDRTVVIVDEIRRLMSQVNNEMRNRHERAIRLLGVSLTNLHVPQLPAASLLNTDRTSDRWQQIDEVTDAVWQRYGPSALTTAVSTIGRNVTDDTPTRESR